MARYSGYKCAGCDAFLTGRQTKWCGDACRMRGARLARSTQSAVKRGAIVGNLDVKVLQDERCAYCGSEENLELDHTIPISRGGTHTTDEGQLKWACTGCNRGPGGKHSKIVGVEWEPKTVEVRQTWWDENKSGIIFAVIMLSTVYYSMTNQISG